MTTSQQSETASASSLPPTMTAWRQDHYGGPDSVTKETIPVPAPRRGEVLIRTRATALNAGDVHLMRGDPLLVRLFFGLRAPRIAGRGMDVAGTVVAIGPGVTDWVRGDEVVGEVPGGGLAEYVVAPASRLVGRPDSVDAVSAAVLPVAAGTAWRARELAQIEEGARVLVLGASGGVGTFTVQLLALSGAEVWAACGARNRDLVASLGAVRTFDYRETAATEHPESSFDAVIDISGRDSLRDLRRLVRDAGTVVLVTGEGGRLLGPMGRMLRAAMMSVGSRRRIRPLAATPEPASLRTLLSLVDQGKLTPVIERTWPLAQARSAIAHIDAGHTVGKVAVVADVS